MTKIHVLLILIRKKVSRVIQTGHKFFQQQNILFYHYHLKYIILIDFSYKEN